MPSNEELLITRVDELTKELSYVIEERDAADDELNRYDTSREIIAKVLSKAKSTADRSHVIRLQLWTMLGQKQAEIERQESDGVNATSIQRSICRSSRIKISGYREILANKQVEIEDLKASFDRQTDALGLEQERVRQLEIKLETAKQENESFILEANIIINQQMEEISKGHQLFDDLLERTNTIIGHHNKNLNDTKKRHRKLRRSFRSKIVSLESKHSEVCREKESEFLDQMGELTAEIEAWKDDTGKIDRLTKERDDARKNAKLYVERERLVDGHQLNFTLSSRNHYKEQIDALESHFGSNYAEQINRLEQGYDACMSVMESLESQLGVNYQYAIDEMCGIIQHLKRRFGEEYLNRISEIVEINRSRSSDLRGLELRFGPDYITRIHGMHDTDRELRKMFGDDILGKIADLIESNTSQRAEMITQKANWTKEAKRIEQERQKKEQSEKDDREVTRAMQEKEQKERSNEEIVRTNHEKEEEKQKIIKTKNEQISALQEDKARLIEELARREPIASKTSTGARRDTVLAQFIDENETRDSPVQPEKRIDLKDSRAESRLREATFDFSLVIEDDRPDAACSPIHKFRTVSSSNEIEVEEDSRPSVDVMQQDASPTVVKDDDVRHVDQDDIERENTVRMTESLPRHEQDTVMQSIEETPPVDAAKESSEGPLRSRGKKRQAVDSASIAMTRPRRQKTVKVEAVSAELGSDFIFTEDKLTKSDGSALEASTQAAWNQQVVQFADMTGNTGMNWQDIRSSSNCVKGVIKDTKAAWTIDEPMQYACRSCANTNTFCVVWNSVLSSFVVLPLPRDVSGDGPALFISGSKKTLSRSSKSWPQK
ncbi:hypothetical protein M438DRAFT_392650 [Aureobasidium pullulans EXF-150]|uniref:Uncharacterized protein n=1 Tax=Aureobasidium pullulans EXF-150 TaxID=1043002 RepID=A0A074YCI2_AURPU|nr:uncharacterized protein M438DRAFT_392650 [Aureobasidium pullulans EXF-150]KEQ84551.1 hypothetical protein M438DRAFT_392650 [Aureobasidium pullulans EXF-150]